MLPSQVTTASRVHNLAHLGFVLIPAQLITGLTQEDKFNPIRNKSIARLKIDFMSDPLIEIYDEPILARFWI